MMKKITGVTIRTCMADVIIPPTMGAAIGFKTSDPMPVLQSIGRRPPSVAATVMSFGRRRSTAPATTASKSSVVRHELGPACWRCSNVLYRETGH